MQRVFVVGFGLTLLLACGRSKVVSGGTGGNGGTSAMPDGGDGAPNEVMDGSMEQAELDAGEPTDVPPVVDDSDSDAAGADETSVAADAGGADETSVAADAGGADETSVAADAGGGVIEPCTGLPPLAVLCSGYCNDVADACPDLFADFDACLEVCTAPAWSCGSPGATSGNSLYCRITHSMAASAASSAAATECPKAGPNSTSCL